jgi:xanthine dehydrogenase YagS FAD-binding subunit
MRAFEHATPTTKEEALSLLSGRPGEAVLLAGGTDLISLMKDDVVAPRRVINIKSIQELQGISYDSGKGLRLGALVTLQELLSHDRARQEYPSLVQAAEGVMSPQIQNVGTVGGDLCQKPRCWYYRKGFGLLGRQNGRSLVVDGDNRYHAILGNEGPAYFVNASSLAPALIALDAQVTIAGPERNRQVDLNRFFRIPKSENEREYDLAPNEIIVEILVPPAAQKRNAAYELRQREALDWPLAAAAVALTLQGSQVQEARIVLGHVAPTPWLAEAAGTALRGKTISAETADQAGEAAVRGAKALSRNQYKIRLARVAVKRALLRAAGMEV